MGVTSHLVFDVTDATTQAASANVGAYVRDAAGNLITSTLDGSKQALDVHVANPIDIEVQLDHTDGDSVKIGDGTDLLSVNSDGSLNITDNGGSLTVDGTVAATQSGSWTVAVSGTVAVTQSTSPWIVSATDLDIRDLIAASDSVSSWLKDGSGNSITSTTGWLDVNIAGGSVAVSDAALADTACTAAAVSVGVTATAASASILANRKYAYYYNNGSKAMYLGPTGVTTSSGFPMFPGMGYEFRIGAGIDMKVIAAGASQDLRGLQLS